MAGGALAQAGRPGARRAPAAARRDGRTARAVPSRCRSTGDHETNELRDGGKSIGRLAGASSAAASACRASSKLLEEIRRAGDLLRAGGHGAAPPRRARRVIAEGHEIGIHSWIHELNSVLLVRSRERHDAACGRYAGKDQRHAAGRLAHRLMGFLPAHVAHHEGDGATLQFLADGGRGMLRTDARRRADRRGRAAGRVGARRRGLFHDAPLPVAAPADAGRGVFDIFRREFDAAYEEGGICQLTCIRM